MVRFVLLGLLLVLGLGAARLWWKAQRVYGDSRYQQFQAASAPAEVPNGFWPGNWQGGGTNWLGKEFDVNTMTGINIFQAEPTPTKGTPFKIRIGPSMTGSTQTVLILDYNVAGNRPWIRLVRDEVVELAPGKLLGILYYTLGPIMIPIDFFEQQQAESTA